MVTVGPNNPGTAYNTSLSGGTNWVNLGALFTSNDTRGSVQSLTGATTNYATANNFGFSIPSGARINGILVEWEKGWTGFGSARDNQVRILKNGSIGNQDKAVVGFFAGADAYVSYGGATDLWNETWTPAQIGSTGFGALLSGTFPGNATIRLDHVRITVYYDLGVNMKTSTKYW